MFFFLFFLLKYHNFKYRKSVEYIHIYLFYRCWFCHKTSGQCHQTNSGDQPRWGQSSGENPEHLQKHRDLLQTGRGVRWDHTRWPPRQSKWSHSEHKPTECKTPVCVADKTLPWDVIADEGFFSSSCVWLQSTFTMDGDNLVQVQKWDGKETTFVREIKDGKMVMVSFNERHITW